MEHVTLDDDVDIDDDAAPVDADVDDDVESDEELEFTKQSAVIVVELRLNSPPLSPSEHRKSISPTMSFLWNVAYSAKHSQGERVLLLDGQGGGNGATMDEMAFENVCRDLITYLMTTTPRMILGLYQ